MIRDNQQMVGSSHATIIIIDDVLQNLHILSDILPEHGYDVRPFPSGKLALQAIGHEIPDLILLDVMMPDMDGFEVCQALKSSSDWADIPVIFLSASGDTFDKVKGFQLGAVDYITKPFQIDEVLVRIDTHLTIARQRQQLIAYHERDLTYLVQLNELKNDIIRTANHDLRNPLSAIMIYLELLQGQIDSSNPKTERYLRAIERTTENMKNLLTNVLDIATIETGNAIQREKIAIHTLIHDSVIPLDPLFEKSQLRFEMKLPEDEHYVVVDGIRIKQVLNNLLTNAIKYTPPGGRISLTVTVSEHSWLFEVQDSGLGIPEQDLPHIFDRFHRVETEQHLQSSGTGLGLYIVQQIVNQHNGSIEVQSKLGLGTTFTVTFA